MSRYVTSGTKTTISTLNAELEKIATSQEDFLSLSGEAPNQLNASIDMNSNRILNLPTPVLPTDVVRLQDLQYGDGGAAAEELITPQKFGAIADGVTDDTLALQEWANVGGRLYLPRGVYKITAPINITSCTTIFGESSGTGTFNEGSLLNEAALGASIISMGADFVGEAGFSYKRDTAAIYSVSIRDIKFYTKGSDSHCIRIYKGYDHVNLQNINFLQMGDNSSAIKMTGNVDDAFNETSQTILIQNVMGIHDYDRTTATAPTFEFIQCQEMNLIGVKAFGGSQGNLPNCYGIRLARCRGVQLYGCSFAHSQTGGLLIEAAGRLCTGIVVDGCTFENLYDYAIRLIGDDLVVAPVNAISIRAPRFQFPLSLGIYCDFVTNSNLEAEYVGMHLTTNTLNNVVTTRNLAQITDLTTSIDNTITQYGNVSDQATIHLNKQVVQSITTPAFGLRTPNGDEFGIKWSATDTANFGLELNDPRTSSLWRFAPNNDFVVSKTNRGVVLRNLNDDTDYRIRLDQEGNIVSQSLTNPSDRKINSDIPRNITTIVHTLEFNDTGKTIWMDNPNPNTVFIPTFASIPFNPNTVMQVVQLGAGSTFIQAPVGVTLNGVDNGIFSIPAQWKGCRVVNRANDEWAVIVNDSEEVNFQITYDDPAAQTFTRQATNTYLNRKSAAAVTYTLDSSTFLLGDRVLVSRFRTAAGTITMETNTQTFYPASGNATYPQTLSILGTMILTKTSLGWDVTGDNT